MLRGNILNIDRERVVDVVDLRLCQNYNLQFVRSVVFSLDRHTQES